MEGGGGQQTFNSYIHHPDWRHHYIKPCVMWYLKFSAVHVASTFRLQKRETEVFLRTPDDDDGSLCTRMQKPLLHLNAHADCGGV